MRTQELLELEEKCIKEGVDIPNEFICPIDKGVMKCPVVASDGNSYEKEAIQTWLKQSNLSPITREPISHQLIYNRNLKNLIENFFEKYSQKKLDNSENYLTFLYKNNIFNKLNTGIKKIGNNLTGMFSSGKKEIISNDDIDIFQMLDHHRREHQKKEKSHLIFLTMLHLAFVISSGRGEKEIYTSFALILMVMMGLATDRLIDYILNDKENDRIAPRRAMFN